jgi:hypothetical protein
MFVLTPNLEDQVIPFSLGDDPDKKGYPGPPGWGLGTRMTTSPHKKCLVEKLSKLETRYRTILKEAKVHQGL